MLLPPGRLVFFSWQAMARGSPADAVDPHRLRGTSQCSRWFMTKRPGMTWLING